MIKTKISLLFFLISLSVSAQISELDYLTIRKDLTKKINQLRISKELPPLKTNIILRKAAKNQSVYMAKNRKIGHGQIKYELGSPFKRVKFFKGIEFEIVGENVLHTSKAVSYTHLTLPTICSV